MSGCRVRDPETFPVGTLRRVDRPTTAIDDESVKRVKEGDAGFIKARRGLYGPAMEHEVVRFVQKHPMSGAESWMMDKMRSLVDGMAAAAEGADLRRPECYVATRQGGGLFSPRRCCGRLPAAPLRRLLAQFRS